MSGCLIKNTKVQKIKYNTKIYFKNDKNNTSWQMVLLYITQQRRQIKPLIKSSAKINVFYKKKVQFGKFYNIYNNSLYKETTQNTFQECIACVMELTQIQKL